MKNYIVRNCPAYNINTNHCRNEIIADCKDITNCVMKKIVDELKTIECGQYYNNKCDNGCDCCEVESKRKILQMLEIEEVNE